MLFMNSSKNAFGVDFLRRVRYNREKTAMCFWQKCIKKYKMDAKYE